VPEDVTREGFLLLKQWRDSRDGIRLELWVASSPAPLCIALTHQEAVMFVERFVKTQAGRRKPVQLLSLAGNPVDALYFAHQRELVAERDRLQAAGERPCEADVKPIERFLMERFILGGLKATGPAKLHRGVLYMTNPRLSRAEVVPHLRLLSLDIETIGFEGELLSIACVTETTERVFLVGSGPEPQKSLHPDGKTIRLDDARATLQAFFSWVAHVDPDILVGWNVIEFDLKYLASLCKSLNINFALGRGGEKAEILAPRSRNFPYVARVPGRVVLDGIATLKSATFRFESFALNNVAHEFLGRRKKIDHGKDPVEEITRMAREDPDALAEYNLEDCRLVLDIFEKARLVEFAVERQRLTGLQMDRQGGSVAAFDQLYLPRLHRAGYVAPSLGSSDFQESSPGGYVMESKPGFYRNVLVLDFKSLYPSIIRTFLVDPLGLALGDTQGVEGFEGAWFARNGHILPEMIRKMWSARDEAKREKNAAMSQAIKIIMNSFYGVLGTPGCRFFDQRLVSSITLRGHDIIQKSRAYLEKAGFDVIYGDTDSLFVLLDQGLEDAPCRKIGKELAQSLTDYFRELLRRTMQIESHLELEFETHFQRFLMPTIRGSDVGSKKRYAGSIVGKDGSTSIVFKGLEAVRTDWTPLARNFQRELYRRIFSDEPFEQYVRQIGRELRTGQLDEQLAYKKRLRRPINEYVSNVPPHVQAARLLEKPGRSVEYVITVNGPEPVQKRRSPYDYQHYLERQLAPAADGILYFFETDFARLAGNQMSLF